MTFAEAMKELNREERFESTVAAMNALLIAKGVYSSDEFAGYFVESAKAKIKKRKALTGDSE